MFLSRRCLSSTEGEVLDTQASARKEKKKAVYALAELFNKRILRSVRKHTGYFLQILTRTRLRTETRQTPAVSLSPKASR